MNDDPRLDATAQPRPHSQSDGPTQEPEKSRQKTGRNQLCPCGSGDKFKRCCLRKGEGRSRTPQDQARRTGDLERATDILLVAAQLRRFMTVATQVEQQLEQQLQDLRQAEAGLSERMKAIARAPSTDDLAGNQYKWYWSQRIMLQQPIEHFESRLARLRVLLDAIRESQQEANHMVNCLMLRN